MAFAILGLSDMTVYFLGRAAMYTKPQNHSVAAMYLAGKHQTQHARKAFLKAVVATPPDVAPATTAVKYAEPDILQRRAESWFRGHMPVY